MWTRTWIALGLVLAVALSPAGLAWAAARVTEVVIRYDDGSEQRVRPASTKPDAPPATQPSTQPSGPPTTAPSGERLALYPGQAIHVRAGGVVRTWDFGDAGSAFDRLTGFNAAHVYDRPGDYVLRESPAGDAGAGAGPAKPTTRAVRVVAESRKEVRVERDANLADVLARVAARTRVVLPRGTLFDLKEAVRIKVSDVLLTAAEGDGPRPRIRNLASAAHTPALLVMAERFGVSGIEFDTDVPVTANNAKTSRSAIRIERGSAVVRDCVFRNVDDGVHCDPGSTGAVVQECRFTREVRAYNVWIDGSDVVILGNAGENSVHEHNLRSNSKAAKFVLIHGNEFSNPPRMAKETITLREVEWAYVSGNTLRTGWAQIGLKDATADSVTRHVVFDANTLLDGAWFQVNPASVDVVLCNNRIVCPEDSYVKEKYWDPVRLNGPYTAGVRVEGNVRVVETATDRPFVRIFNAPREVVERENRTETAK